MSNQLDNGINLLSALSENYEAIYFVDFDKNTIVPFRMSKVIEENFGEYFRSAPSYEEAMTKYVNIMVAPEDREAMLERSKPEYIKAKLKEKRAYSYDFRVNREGNLYYRLKVANLDGVGELHHAVVGFADVSPEMERINQLIESQAMLKLLEKDELTGLYTKEFFFKMIEEYIEGHPDEELMMWTSDVRGLKVINEKYGMNMGNEILRIMAKGGNAFPGFLFGGRIEGDKFSALMKDTHPDIEKVNELITSSFHKVFPIPNVVIKHGIYHIKKDDTLSIQGMCDRSILAIQNIKDKFGVNVAEYDDKLRQDLLLNRQILECAPDSLVAGEFKVYFQPKVDTAQAKVSGAEALVRWIHPEFGFMNPGVFIPLFEKNGFITKMDMFIWEEVCKSIVEWKEKGVPVVPVSVNVSRYDFEDPKLADKIIALADKYGVEHKLLEIEVTETSYSDNPEVIKETIKKLHDNGFTIALDDFGTGYSSMIALSSLDLDIMKLDMSLIQNDIPGTDKNVLEFSMQLAQMMKLSTVAEGVETDDQAKRIKELGGDFIQGYFYSRPLPKADYEAFVTGK